MVDIATYEFYEARLTLGLYIGRYILTMEDLDRYQNTTRRFNYSHLYHRYLLLM